MPVTDYTRDFPRVIIFPPDHGELECATVIFAILFMAKAMFTDLDRAMIFDGVNLESAWHEISPYVGVAREDLFEILPGLLVIGQATGVVIELKVISKHRHQTIEIVPVECVKYRAVHAGDCVE